MKTATGKFIAIFDADFIPPRDILMNVVQYFTDRQVGLVQVRWDHLNRDASLLTKSQAIFLDGHFVIEHTARNRSGRFMHFNGTAGVWRRSTIEDAGGWEHDTLTEDLDLSYRAQLKGWKFVYLPQFCTPAIAARNDRIQAAGPPLDQGFVPDGYQVAPQGSEIPRIIPHKDRGIFPPDKHACLSVDGSFDALDVPDVLPVRHAIQGAYMGIVYFFCQSICLGHLFGQHVLRLRPARAVRREAGWKTLLYMPFLMGLGIGVGLNNAKAVFEAI